jgi:hypothetical protein
MGGENEGGGVIEVGRENKGGRGVEVGGGNKGSEDLITPKSWSIT